MQKKDKQDFVELLTVTAENYEREFSEVMLELWWKALAKHDLKAVRRAFTEHIATHDWMPRVSQILRRLDEKTQKSPLLAWVEVERAICKHGAYETVQFDPVTNAVIRDMGGGGDAWPWLCQQNLDEPWTQKEFERRYGEYQQHGVNYSTPLQGLVEQNNRLKGYHDHIPEPVLIGDGPVALPEPDRSGEVLSKLKQMVDQEEKPESGEEAA